MSDDKIKVTVVCPNCEETVEVAVCKDDSFPCPVCAFMISANKPVEKSHLKIARFSFEILAMHFEHFITSKYTLTLGSVLAGMVLTFYLVFFNQINRLFSERKTPPTGVSSAGGIITNNFGMSLRLIPAGTFTMGSLKGRPDERPVRSVTITKPFYIGIHEVTVKQYSDVTGEKTRVPMPPDNPVLFITWDKAKEFCRILSERENLVYRLPTEAEWEYSARAGTETEFYWGDTYRDGFAWCHYNSGRPTRSTHPVGTLQPNAWGLYDMLGNIAEWCEDYYLSSYSPDDTTDPIGPLDGKFRVIRGGDYSSLPYTSASRSNDTPDTMMGPGFRVVRNP
ncbi:MAG: SUMF1/EgtB/PvdO family nonheme iron enzyme [Candidatus Riflebacteria bacterium]|nr:SUMF1/EgtB/PvdO family nonheme iron enzyme [Candidatus Riflebacteria bacterium]